VILIRFPTFGLLRPLAIRAATPGATAGMVKLVVKFPVVLMREALQVGGLTVVFWDTVLSSVVKSSLLYLRNKVSFHLIKQKSRLRCGSEVRF
jgi:hypothetical protein